MQQLNNATKNHTEMNDRPFHSWYQFVLGYPPHFVRHCLSKFEVEKGDLVLDPFCGTGTTNVECKRLGIDSFGLEANPMTYFASCVKTNWDILPAILETRARTVAFSALKAYKKFGLAEDSQLLSEDLLVKHGAPIDLKKEPVLNADQKKVLPKDFISRKPLQKVLVLRELILQESEDEPIRDALLLALASVTVNNASNLAFGPEVYTSKKKVDAPVVGSFLLKVADMVKDLMAKPESYGSAHIVQGDARRMIDYFSAKDSVDCVITSPPYPNEKDYTRITRLESIILGFMTDRESVRAIKRDLLRSNSRNIFIADKDDEYVTDFAPVKKLAEEIERETDFSS